MPPGLEALAQQVAQLATEETAKNLEAAALRVLELQSRAKRSSAEILILVQALRRLRNAALAVDLTSLNAVPAYELETAEREARELLSYFREVQ